MTDQEKEERRTPINDDDPLVQRAFDHAVTAHRWLDAHRGGRDNPDDPRTISAWFATLLPAKIVRALHGIGCADMDAPLEPADYDGSAKVALIAIERSRAAWQQIALTDKGRTSATAIAPLAWLEAALERMFPRAESSSDPLSTNQKLNG